MRLRLGLFGLLLSSAVSAGPIERLTLVASPISSFAPTNLVVRVHVTPDPANRALEVIAESSDYLCSSRMQLAGHHQHIQIEQGTEGARIGFWQNRLDHQHLAIRGHGAPALL